MGDDIRCRNWFIRVSKKNNTKDKGLYEYDFDNLYNQLIEKYDNVLMALHDKDETNIHIHLVIQTKNAIRFSTLKTLIPYGDIEKQRGSNLECYNYCLHIDEKSKETEKDEYDETCLKTNIDNIENWKRITKGMRTDLTIFKDKILEGQKFEDLLDENTTELARYKNFYNDVRNIYLNKQFSKAMRNVEVTYIYGAPGLGKTYYVYDKYDFDNVYKVSDYKYPFDEYNGEDVILLDDYRADFDISFLLRFLDSYPLKLRARYSNKVACFTKVFITSNWNLEEQYKNIDYTTKLALNRRIHKVIKFTSFGKYKEMKINGLYVIDNEELKKRN